MNGNTDYQFTVIDYTLPTIQLNDDVLEVEPENNTENNPKNTTIRITFTKSIILQNSNEIYLKTDNPDINTIIPSIIKIDDENDRILTIKSTSRFKSTVVYYLEIGSNSIKDYNNHFYLGLTKGEYQFTSEDYTLPGIILNDCNPVNKETDVSLTNPIDILIPNSIIIQFTEDVSIVDGLESLISLQSSEQAFNEDTGDIEDVEEIIPINMETIGTQLILTPHNMLKQSTLYFVKISGGAIWDETNYLPSIYRSPDLSEYYYSFVTIDDIPPEIQLNDSFQLNITPIHQSINVLKNTPIIITFNEPIQIKNHHNIRLKEFDTDIPINITSTIIEETKLHIIANNNGMTSEMKYYVEITADAIQDKANNPNLYAGIQGVGLTKTEYEFTVIDYIPPVINFLQGLNPLNLASEVSPDTDITIDFSENIIIQNNNSIYLKKEIDDEIIPIVIPINIDNNTGNQVPTTRLTINPNIYLPSKNKFYVQIDSDAISDITGNYFTGLIKNDYSFTSQDYEAPEIIRVIPSYNMVIDELEPKILIKFNENIKILNSNDNLNIINFNTNINHDTIPFSDSTKLVIQDSQLVIQNYIPFEYNKEYYITFGNNIISDISQSENIFAGILDSSILIGITIGIISSSISFFK